MGMKTSCITLPTLLNGIGKPISKENVGTKSTWLIFLAGFEKNVHFYQFLSLSLHLKKFQERTSLFSSIKNLSTCHKFGTNFKAVPVFLVPKNGKASNSQLEFFSSDRIEKLENFSNKRLFLQNQKLVKMSYIRHIDRL